MKALTVEIAVAEYFGVRRNIIVPNVSWGLNIHECDMLIVSQSHYATEIEIKTNKYDLIKDKEKTHGHKSNMIRRLFFAIPEELYKMNLEQHIPERAGIIVIRYIKGRYYEYKAVVMRNAKSNKDARELKNHELQKLGHLGCMRIYDLKRTIERLTIENRQTKL